MYYRRKILLSILERSKNQTITKLSLQKILFSKSSFPIMPNSTKLVCTAGINEKGEWRRIYPIPFRELKEIEKYKKYQYYFGCLFENSASLRLSKLRLIENHNLCSCIHWYFLYFSISFNSRKGIG